MVTVVLDGLGGFPAGLSPTFSFHLSPTSFQLSPSSFQLCPSSICLSGWVLVVGFPAGLSPTSFHLFPTSFHLYPTSFHCLPGRAPVVGFPGGPSPTSACGRVLGWLVSHLLSFVCHFLSFGFPAGLSPASQTVALVLDGLVFNCVPVLCICLLGWVLLFPTSLNVSPISFHLFLRLGACGPVPDWFVSHFVAFVSHFLLFVSRFFSFVSYRLGACSRTSGRIVSYFLAFVSHFFPKQFIVRGVTNSFLRRIRPLCHCWCLPISTGHVIFLLSVS